MHASPRDIERHVRAEATRISQNAVADAMGVSPSTVSRILSGESGVPLERLGGFLSAFGLAAIPVEELRALRAFAVRYLERAE